VAGDLFPKNWSRLCDSLSRKRFAAEKIMGMLREADISLAQGGKVGEMCRSLGVSEES
jgi:putative transposase